MLGIVIPGMRTRDKTVEPLKLVVEKFILTILKASTQRLSTRVDEQLVLSSAPVL